MTDEINIPDDYRWPTPAGESLIRASRIGIPMAYSPVPGSPTNPELIMDEQKLGQKIVIARAKAVCKDGSRGISQAELAERADLAPNTIVGVERGTITPTVRTLARIEEALPEIGMTIEEMTSLRDMEACR